MRHDNLMKNKPKQIMKPNSQLNTILIDKILGGSQLKKERKNKSIRLKIDYETQLLTDPMLNNKI